MMKRNGSIELSRAIFMFAIVLQHIAGFAGHNIPWFTNMVDLGVTGFVLISGWYGIRFSLLKLIRLWLVALWCLAIVQIGTVIIGGTVSVNGCLDTLFSWWFLHAYTILFLLAPLLNMGIEKGLGDKNIAVILLPVVFILFFWIYPTTISPIAWLLPKPSGIKTTSALTLVCIYAISRCMRYYIENSAYKVRPLMAAIVIVICLSINAVGFGSFTAPTAFIVVSLIFLLLKEVSLPAWVNGVFIWLSPSLFAVYLLHVNGVVWGYIAPRLEDSLLSVGVPSIMMFVITGLTVFIGCVIVDLPRRLVFKVIGKKLSNRV